MTDGTQQEQAQEQPAMQTFTPPQVVDMAYLTLMENKISQEYAANKAQFDAFAQNNANAMRVIQLAKIALGLSQSTSDYKNEGPSGDGSFMK